MTTSSILILGASGTTGRRVTRLLQSQGHSVRAASRHADVRFDWKDPGTWEQAVGPASRMYLMAPHEQPIDPAFVSLAVSKGIRRIVLLSSQGIEIMGDERLMSAERLVRGSGVDWTLVRPDWFNQNFDEGFFKPAVLAGRITLPVGETKQAFVDADDIAAVVTVALTKDGHEGQSYDVSGPRALSFGEASAIIGRAAGRQVRFAGDADTYLSEQRALGRPDEAIQGEIKAYGALLKRGDATPTDTVRAVTGHAPKSFETYAAQAAASGAWK
ncbi:NAD(P)H-binding protein [Myxococcus sp. CA051A]|uniref:NAD(P)H-binding protein n=1 Tax=unclassified Myxococcus TaxID=2648731 RepID=UPI00157B8A84|nr:MULTISPECIES: NAD(P)H-binding protein [unclassified Myxococcus]NTX33374.1 NAD(P)H-binding protein [Myxococcus sp. CA033]NTX59519.1 NAD(P)H-binding protein [Myxococcus sp. CA051A]